MAATIDNMVSFRAFPQSIYAIQPNYFQTAESYFLLDFGSDFGQDTSLLEPFVGHPDGSGLDFGEQLYTARGSQGMGVMGFVEMLFMINTLHDQPDKIENGFGSSLFKLQLETDMSTTEYMQRAIFMTNYAPGF